MRRYYRNKREGRLHRGKLRGWILARLRVGDLVPTGRFAGRLLGLGESEGYRHMRRVLDEAGVVTAKLGRRLIVVAFAEVLPDAESWAQNAERPSGCWAETVSEPSEAWGVRKGAVSSPVSHSPAHRAREAVS